jgi:hypothetical protein
VNTAALLTPIAGLTWTKQGTGNGQAVATAGNTVTVTYTAINISSALGSNVTVTEIAINSSTTNTNVFDRDIVSPPVALLTGDQALVTIQLVMNYSPITATAVGNVATGYDSSGTLQIESLLQTDGAGVQFFTDAAGGKGTDGVGPPVASWMSLYTATFTQQAFNVNTGLSGTSTDLQLANAGYGTGNRYRDSGVTYSISQGNGTIYGVALRGSSNTKRVVSLKFTTPFTKLSTQTLSFTWRKSWQRVLTN